MTAELALVGHSDAIESVRQAIRHAAAVDLPVLLHGETGTGKDLVARMIHEASRDVRPGGYAKVSCSALSDADALERELFGFARDVVSDAPWGKPGRLELAAHGTLVLDQVEAVSSCAQAKLLDTLESGTFLRVAGSQRLDSSARFIACTSLPKEQLLQEKMREDLYFRLAGFSIELPSLRARSEDIPALVSHFLEEYAVLARGERRSVSGEDLSRLMGYAWPGNVRELESVTRQFALTGDSSVLTSMLISADAVSADSAPGDRYRENERRLILAALVETHWNRRKAARILGIGYNTLRRRIDRYRLDVAR